MGAVVQIGATRQATAANRRCLSIFPDGYDRSGRTWMYAVGFTDGRIKIGVSMHPRSRLMQYWAQAFGGVEWCHLFGAVSRRKKTCQADAEKIVIRKLKLIGERIAYSEYFHGVSKADVIRCCREAIAECRPAAEATA